MIDKRLSVTLVRSQPVCETQREEMLLPVEFPYYLFISGLGCVNVIKLFPVFQRRSFFRERLAMPVDLSADKQILQPEQVDPATDNIVRCRDKSRGRYITK